MNVAGTAAALRPSSKASTTTDLMPSSSSSFTVTAATKPTMSNPVNMPALFNLPPPLDFDAIRRRQKAMRQQTNANVGGQSRRNSSAATTKSSQVIGMAPSHSEGSSSGCQLLEPEAFQAALNQLFGPQESSQLPSHHSQQQQPSTHANTGSGRSHHHLSAHPTSQSIFSSSQQAHVPSTYQTPPAFPIHSGHMMPTLASGAQQQLQRSHSHHIQHENQQSHHSGSSAALHQQQHTLQPQSYQHPHTQHQMLQQHQQPQHQQSGHAISPVPFPAGPDDHARLLTSASASFSNFAMEMGRTHQTATQLQYVDPMFASCIAGVKTAAQTLCHDLNNITAALRSMSGTKTPVSGWPHSTSGARSLPFKPPSHGLGSCWPEDLASIFAHLEAHKGASTPSKDSPLPSSERMVSCMPSATQAAHSGHASMNHDSLLNFLDQNTGLQSSLPSGPAEQMLDFLTAPSSASAHDVNSTSTDNQTPDTTLPSAGADRKRKEGPGSINNSPSFAPLAASKTLKGSGKHKSRPPIEGVRRESVRYRNRKLLVDMREQLYKWLDTTEFCRIARSYPQGSNGWATVSVDAERPELGTKRIFQPNFEIGSDLYICNKELLEELIELGVQKVKDRPEAYGMKEGVEAKDVVVDVAKDLMDSARHGYRANLKKQQEDEADAKAKSTRYKQQERHRTKVRNREVGAKRLKYPIPDSLLTMGLHSDDAASDQENMHKMNKEEWRKLRMRKLQSKRGWEALAPRWRNPHLTKAYHIADTLSKSKQMPRWRRDGGIELDPPMRLWGKTLPKVVFDPAWLAENEARIKEDPFNIKIEDKEVQGWRDEDHGLSDDTEDELERYEREIIRINRANRKRTAGTAPSCSLLSPQTGSGTAIPTGYGNGQQTSSSGMPQRYRRDSSDQSSVPSEEQRGRRFAIGSSRGNHHSADCLRQSSLGSSVNRSGTSASSLSRRFDDRYHDSATSKDGEEDASLDGDDHQELNTGEEHLLRHQRSIRLPRSSDFDDGISADDYRGMKQRGLDIDVDMLACPIGMA